MTENIKKKIKKFVEEIEEQRLSHPILKKRYSTKKIYSGQDVSQEEEDEEDEDNDMSEEEEEEEEEEEDAATRFCCRRST